MVATNAPCMTELPVSTGTRSTTPSNGARTSLRVTSAVAASSNERAVARPERALSACSLAMLPVLTRRSAASASA